LLIDLSGGTTNACFYLSALESVYGVYTDDPPLPLNTGNLDGWAVNNVQKVLRLASRAQATYSNYEQPYIRGKWFAEGSGRALVAYTEFMSAMGEQVNDVSFKLLPLSYRTDSVSLFYADIIGINPKAIDKDPERRGLALELANLMASKQVMVASIGPTETTGPQYLMPTRPSVFQELGATYPQYNRMYEVVTSGNPGLFVMGVDSRYWLDTMRLAIRDAIYADACPE
jgi:thiamine pyridinylase